MKKKNRFFNILILGVLAVLLVIPGSSNAGSLVGSPLVITEASEQEVASTIAFNSQRHEYLVVWYNDRAGCDDIQAQRVTNNGALVGGPFYISAGCSLDRRFPDVIYNSAADQYLVVWEQYDSASGYSIRGRRVSGTGQVLDTTDLTIRSSGYNLYTPVKPAVAYASTSDRYLVVWSETGHSLPITYAINGQVVKGDGSLDGSMFAISEGDLPREEPDAAYNRHANRYLVVWQLDTGSIYDVHAQQVHGGGGLFQGDITIAYYTVSSTAPAVASIPTSPTNDKFLVVWEFHYAPDDLDIFGRVVAEDGTPGNAFWITQAGGLNESSPAIASSEDSLQYYVTWRHPQGIVDKPVKGRAITYAGTRLDQVTEFLGVAADLPAISAGPTGDFLVSWQDQPVAATNRNIYGQLVGNRIYLPILSRNSP